MAFCNWLSGPILIGFQGSNLWVIDLNICELCHYKACASCFESDKLTGFGPFVDLPKVSSTMSSKESIANRNFFSLVRKRYQDSSMSYV